MRGRAVDEVRSGDVKLGRIFWAMVKTLAFTLKEMRATRVL